MPYERIISSISMWADADMSAGNSQDSLKALGQQLSCVTNGNLEKQTYTAAQVASENPKKIYMLLKPFQQDPTQAG